MTKIRSITKYYKISWNVRPPHQVNKKNCIEALKQDYKLNRWKRKLPSLILLYFWPRYSIPREWKKITLGPYAIQKSTKSSWNEHSSSSFTKQSCSKMALYRWIKTESRWNKRLISLSSPDWSASLRPSLERKTRPDAYYYCYYNSC